MMKLNFIHSIFSKLTSGKYAFLLLLLFFLGNKIVLAQPYYIATGSWLLSYDPGDNLCTMCDHEFHGSMSPANGFGGCSFGPDGSFYVMSWDNDPPYEATNDIFQIDLNTQAPTLIFDGPNDMVMMSGLVAMGNGIFYTMPWVLANNDTLYKWDTNTGIIEAVGSTGYPPWSEMWMAEGYFYYITAATGDDPRQIIRVDPLNPANSEVMCGFLFAYGVFGMTATPVSGLFIGTEI